MGRLPSEMNYKVYLEICQARIRIDFYTIKIAYPSFYYFQKIHKYDII